jgi:plasmid stability protein
VRAAKHGRSMEEEAQDILRKVVQDHSAPTNLAASIRGRLSPSVRIDHDLPPRDTIREPHALVAKKR